MYVYHVFYVKIYPEYNIFFKKKNKNKNEIVSKNILLFY